jgi:hypothetical protein
MSREPVRPWGMLEHANAVLLSIRSVLFHYREFAVL